MKVTQKEFDSLKNRYNKVRALCDSYYKEILELKQKIAKLETDLEIDACLQRYRFSIYLDDKTLQEQEQEHNKKRINASSRT
jgi:hypothetical protein